MLTINTTIPAVTLAAELNNAAADIVSHKVRTASKSRWYQFGNVALLKVRDEVAEPLGFSVMEVGNHYDLAVYDGYSCDELKQMLDADGHLPEGVYYQFEDLYSLALYVFDELGIKTPITVSSDDDFEF